MASTTENLTRKEKLGIMYNDFRKFMYDKEKGEVMGRNAASWGKIGLFFFIYYACLAAFFASMFAIAFSTMPEKKDGPKYTGFISDKPVLHMFPNGGVDSYSKKNLDGITGNYKEYLKAYNEQNSACYEEETCVSGDGPRGKDKKKQCRFNMTSLGPCAFDNDGHFGYKEGAPCVYLRLSKIYGWIPERSGKSHVGLKCWVEDDGDAEVKVYPGGSSTSDVAYPFSYWPFRGERHFMLPLAAVTVSSKNKVKVKCEALADNIKLSKTFKPKKGATGRIEFEVSPASA